MMTADTDLGIVPRIDGWWRVVCWSPSLYRHLPDLRLWPEPQCLQTMGPALPDWPGPSGKWMKKSESLLSWDYWVLLTSELTRADYECMGTVLRPVDCGLISFIKIREIIAGTGGILWVRAWHRDTLTHSPGNWLPPVSGRNARRPLLCVRGRVLRDCNAGPVQGAGAGTVFSPVETSSWSRTRRRQSWHHVLATKNTKYLIKIV